MDKFSSQKRIFSGPVRKAFKRQYGPRGMSFLQMYKKLQEYQSSLEGPVPFEEGFYSTFRNRYRYVLRKMSLDSSKDSFVENAGELKRYFRKLDRKSYLPLTKWKKVIRLFVSMIETAFADKDVYVKKMTLPGRPKWYRFRAASKKEKDVLRLKKTNPELYDLIQNQRELYKQLDENIKDEVVSRGMVPEKKKVYGKIVTTGQNIHRSFDLSGVQQVSENVVRVPRMGQEINRALSNGLDVSLSLAGADVRIVDARPDGTVKMNKDVSVSQFDSCTVSMYEEFVFPNNGEMVRIQDFIEDRKNNRDAMKKLRRVRPDDISDLRSVDGDLVDQAAEDQEYEYSALTDDSEKQSSVTRIYPTVKVRGKKVVAEGRYKGILLDDMVNSVGRMIEGTAYDFDPKTGIPIPFETTKDGEFDVQLPTNREPYVTVNEDGELYIKVPSSHDFTDYRNQMRELAKISPNVEYIDGTRNTSFVFEPEEFGSVRDALQSCALSKSAMKKIRSHYREAAKHEMAIAKKNLSRYDADKLGGFSEEFTESGDLYIKQKQAMAFVNSRGGNGLVALDTGVGKTLTALGIVQDLKRTGEIDTKNGKVLLVCPASLRGNLMGEALDVLSKEAYEDLKDRLDVLSYAQFSREDDGSIMDDYVTVIFDEAQKLKNTSSQRSKNAMRHHPKKVLMTASPMERDPQELKVLTGIANNKDYTTKEGREELRLFKRRFCETVGGRVVGLKKDPSVREKLRTWVKKNAFYSHKQDVEEYFLPSLKRETKAITMPKTVETEYKKVVSDIKGTMEGLVSLYRDKDTDVDSDVTGAIFQLQKEFSKLIELANTPGKKIPGVVSPKIDASVDLIEQRIENQGRSILWTDSVDFAEETAQMISRKLPGVKVAECQSSYIKIWREGVEINEYTKRKYEFDGEQYDSGKWRMAVLNHKIKPASSGVIACVLTSSYTEGYNLQTFDTIIHLDRDSWNAEAMKQRTARTWRNGQENLCREVTMDVVYEEPESEFDRTLDEIKKYIQDMEEDLFDQVIIESQGKALGKEFFEMARKSSSTLEIKKKLFELSMSPYLENTDVARGIDKRREKTV